MISYTLEVPGALLAYDVRRSDSSDLPALFLVGSPMGAAGFTTLAGHFTDRTVITYDPRGVERSHRTDGAEVSTPEEHADDLHRLVEHLNAGPIEMFASSGGAVNALALLTAHPEHLRTLVAHEPPIAQMLPDSEAALRATRAVHEAYQRSGFGAGMVRFIQLVSNVGPVPAGFLEGSAPDPAMFGLPADDDGSRNDPLLAQNIISSTHYQPDLAALRSAGTQLVIGVGTGSEGQLAARAARALAERLGVKPMVFPGDHGGFLGGEYGQMGEPDAFGGALRDVLANAASQNARTPQGDV